VLRCYTAEEAAAALRSAGYPLYALDGAARTSLFDADLPRRAAFVLGGETDGVSPAVRQHVSGLVSIPMSGGVESLNVASAAAVLCFELVRRR
jgi:23S rRNA (guanosine2251-2'-O)-methyltransferase